MKISGESPLMRMGGEDKGRKGEGPTWTFCPGAPKFLRYCLLLSSPIVVSFFRSK